jgi:hypothetical protein
VAKEAFVTTRRPSERKRSCRHRSGSTAVDLIVVCLVIAALIGLLPAISLNREQGNRVKCASNLRNIATHAFIYANLAPRQPGQFPRTLYDPAASLDRSLTGNAAGAASFSATVPATAGVNNTAAAFYLLMRATDLPPVVFMCPSDEVSRPIAEQDVGRQANWPAPYAKFVGYSYNCPYPTAAAVTGGWKFDNSLGPDYPLASDINPGDTPTGGPTAVAFTDGRKVMRAANSPNHWSEGQQVAYGDVHVEWQTSPFAGVQRPGVAHRDNIYASTAGGVGRDGRGGTVWEKPQDGADAVLLPTVQDSPGTAIAARTPDMVAPQYRPWYAWGAWPPVSIPLAVAASAGTWVVARAAVRRRRRGRAVKEVVAAG